mgnify:CR=1 FL=1
MLEMLAVTKAHGLEKTEIASVQKDINSGKGSAMEVDKVSAKFGAWVWVINTLLSAVCLVFCSCMALLGVIEEVGDIVLYQSMFTALSGQIMGIINHVKIKKSYYKFSTC